MMERSRISKELHDPVLTEQAPPGDTPLPDRGDDPESLCSDEDLNPALTGIISKSLAPWMELGPEALDAEIRKLEGAHGEPVYSELIYLLTHLRFPGTQAKSYWLEIVELRHRMQERLGEFVDLRVALASYFVQVNRLHAMPKIIELQLFERTSLVYRDELTGAQNARFFKDSLAREVLRAARTGQPLSLIMIDVDDFGEYNERHGHQAGNVVLTIVARVFAETLRREDLVARLGGGEFGMILPATSKAGAQLVAERARAAIDARDIPHAAGRLSVSMGIATSPGDAAGAQELVRCADRALYGAKAAGKNQVPLYGENRRSFRRIGARLEGRYRILAKQLTPLTTVNIGEGGVRFLTDRGLQSGSLVEVHLTLPGGAGEVTAAGRVVHVEPMGDGTHEAGVRIVALETEDRLRLSRFIEAVCRETDPTS